MATPKPELTEAVGALPSALNPFALSLNENPFPPLPAVRSALIEAIDAANRYPEYLPERLRSLIAGRVGVRDEQVVIGVGATGVILQVLHAVTSPGEKIVMTSPTVDGFPNVVVLRTFSKAYGLAGLRIGYGFCAPDLARRLWTMQLPFGIGITSLVAVAASYDAEDQLRQRIRMIASERRYLRMRLRSMGVYSTDGPANFVFLPPWRQPWREGFPGPRPYGRDFAN